MYIYTVSNHAYTNAPSAKSGIHDIHDVYIKP
ncbi:hypothetical protein [Escherichia phage PH1062]|nr:hypothetical protein [Escherichia phage PH1062]